MAVPRTRRKGIRHKTEDFTTKTRRSTQRATKKTRGKRRVQKPEGRDHEGDKGGRGDDTGFVSFVVYSSGLSPLVFSLVFRSSLWPFVLIFVSLW
jgi:hypothetical protein